MDCLNAVRGKGISVINDDIIVQILHNKNISSFWKFCKIYWINAFKHLFKNVEVFYVQCRVASTSRRATSNTW